MKNKTLKTLFIINGIFVFAASLLGPLYAVFAQGVDKDVFAISFTWFAFLISTTLCLLMVGKYGDRVKRKNNLLLGGYLIRALVWFAFPLATSLPLLVFFQILLGAGEALGSPTYDAIFAEHLDRGKHIQEYTDWKLIYNLVSAVAVLAGGAVVTSYGFSALFFLMGILASVSFLGLLLRPREILQNT
jgi:DHA1 family bicyclomycin/chloramphenicol resistance-like MFS transporter